MTIETIAVIPTDGGRMDLKKIKNFRYHMFFGDNIKIECGILSSQGEK